MRKQEKVFDCCIEVHVETNCIIEIRFKVRTPNRSKGSRDKPEFQPKLTQRLKVIVMFLPLKSEMIGGCGLELLIELKSSDGS